MLEPLPHPPAIQLPPGSPLSSGGSPKATMHQGLDYRLMELPWSQVCRDWIPWGVQGGRGRCEDSKPGGGQRAGP